MSQPLERPEWEAWVKGLSQEELKAEVEREEGEQRSRLQVLSEIENRIETVEQAIVDEKLPERVERSRSRRIRIDQIRRVISEWTKQINEIRGKIRGYRDKVSAFQDILAYQEERVRWLPTFMFWERYQGRERIRDLKRSIGAYRGHITRQNRILSKLVSFRGSDIAELGAHERWMRVEAPLGERLRNFTESLRGWEESKTTLEKEVVSEEERIEFKKTLLIEEYFRVQKSREYFAEKPSASTPTPFAEFRVWVYTQNKENWPEYVMGNLLNELEWVISLNVRRTHIVWAKAVWFEQRFEDRPVDEDEVDAPLDEPQYHVIFYKTKGVKKEWVYKHETVMGWIRAARLRTKAPESIRQTSIEEWKAKPTPPRKFKPRKKRR